MKEIAAIYTYENSESAIRNITSGTISKSHHKGCFLHKKEGHRHRNANH